MRLRHDNDDVEYLWSILPRPTPEHVIRLFARRGDKRIGDFARTFQEFSRFVDSAVGKEYNVYVAPNPTKSTVGVRHSTKDVTHWSWMFIDMDPVEDVNDPEKAMWDALTWLGEWTGRNFRQRIPLLINSGRGVQAWIKLDDVHLYENVVGMTTDKMQRDGINYVTDYKTPRKVMSYWLKRLADKLGVCYGCRVDTTVSDLPRVMRVPATVNIKTGKSTCIINDNEIEEFSGLANILVTGTPDRVFEEPEAGEYPVGTPWQVVFSSLTLKAQTYLLQGAVEPGRHEKMWHTAKKLQELGISKEQANSALEHANQLRGMDNALGVADIQHAVDTAYKV